MINLISIKSDLKSFTFIGPFDDHFLSLINLVNNAKAGKFFQEFRDRVDEALESATITAETEAELGVGLGRSRVDVEQDSCRHISDVVKQVGMLLLQVLRPGIKHLHVPRQTLLCQEVFDCTFQPKQGFYDDKLVFDPVLVLEGPIDHQLIESPLSLFEQWNCLSLPFLQLFLSPGLF